jgi:rare lipoprotein A
VRINFSICFILVGVLCVSLSCPETFAKSKKTSSTESESKAVIDPKRSADDDNQSDKKAAVDKKTAAADSDSDKSSSSDKDPGTSSKAPKASKSSKTADGDKDDDDSPARGRKSFSGNVSWYGIPFHGRKTASGEVFDMNKLSAAHLKLPLPSRALVEDPRSGNAVIVRVNDRGPYCKTRVMDLSREAGRKLGILSRGVGYADITVLEKKSK